MSLFIFIALLLSGCSPAPSSADAPADTPFETIENKGSDTMVNLALAWAETYNPVDQLTMPQISAIYTGQITNWREVGGEDRPIVLLSRESNSGAYVFFLEEVIRQGDADSDLLFSPDTLLLPSSEGISAEIRQNPNTILGARYSQTAHRGFGRDSLGGAGLFWPDHPRPLGADLPGRPDRPDGLTGALLLGYMALPTIISVAEDALDAVPKSYRDASLAMGATRWQTIWMVVVPAARAGIVTAVMLGMGRAIGETMAVMMVTGNAARCGP